jgi:hypothetical protein
MPALARVRMIAYRMVCGSNLSGIGKALLLYAGDSQESYPMPGVSGSLTNYAANMQRLNSYDGATTVFTDNPVQGTIGSVFFMLIKYEDVAAKQFNCKGDSKAEMFKISSYGPGSPATVKTTQTDVTKLYDFGSLPGKHNSYSYHNPFAHGTPSVSGFPVSVNSKPNAPLAADRNPGLDKNALAYLVGGSTQGGSKAVNTTADLPYAKWLDGTYNEYKDKDFVYNAYPHQREGQNVLYNDGHVKFESQTNVGIDNDNIYQRMLAAGTYVSSTTPKPGTPLLRETGGWFPSIGGTASAPTAVATEITPADSEDAMLINEINP